jgi:hypothetical protein
MMNFEFLFAKSLCYSSLDQYAPQNLSRPNLNPWAQRFADKIAVQSKQEHCFFYVRMIGTGFAVFIFLWPSSRSRWTVEVVIIAVFEVIIITITVCSICEYYWLLLVTKETSQHHR